MVLYPYQIIWKIRNTCYECSSALSSQKELNYAQTTLKSLNEHLAKWKVCSIFTDKKGVLQEKNEKKKMLNVITYIIRENKGKDKICEFPSICGLFYLGFCIGST